MQKPNGYDQAPAYTGGSKQLDPGGYVCRIKDAKEETLKETHFLTIAFDICEGEQSGFFADAFKAKQQFASDAKWPGVYRQTVENKDGGCNPFFKGMIACIEESNPGYKFNFDERALAGKLFGGVFGQEEYPDANGNVRVSTKLQQIRTVDAIRRGDFTIPEIKREKPKPPDNTGASNYLPWN